MRWVPDGPIYFFARLENQNKTVIIQRHPDPAGRHLLHAIADAYAQGAIAAAHDLKSAIISLAQGARTEA
jgi:hypothetical protein